MKGKEGVGDGNEIMVELQELMNTIGLKFFQGTASSN